MIFGQSKLELKVGIFVFVGIIILSFFVLSMKEFRSIATGYELNFIFNFANGVKVGAPVRFAGVDVGEVKNISFYTPGGDPAPKVRITGYIKNNIKVPIDSQVWVNTLGLLGEKYIEIMPGEDNENALPPKGSMVGVDPIPMQEISVLARDIAKNLDESIKKLINKEGTIGKLLYDDEVYKELDALITDIRKNPWKLFRKTKEKK
ncbi:MAG: MlaD family protein [Candidatus Omnitrophota bacterium]|jgi:phospholipid/cholesterol/gamma-HCH transport system substrate-binding protein